MRHTYKRVYNNDVFDGILNYFKLLDSWEQIWDVLSNEEVVDIVASASQSTAARALVESAVRAWKTKFPFCKVDDCAAVCLFFDSDLDFKSTDTKDKLIPEASIDQSEQLALLGEKGVGNEAEKKQQ